MSRATDLAELAAWLARSAPALSCYSAAWMADRLQRLERRARRHAERQCDSPLYAEAAQERERRLLCAKADSLLAFRAAGGSQPLAGWRILFEGDPRGSCARIVRPDGDEMRL